MGTPRWRQQGQEPDYRFTLANERTFLAWIRTTLALLAAAAALDVVHLSMPRVLQHWLAVLLALGGAIGVVQAWLGWARTERAMRLGRPLPEPRAGMPLVLLVLVVAAAIGVAMAVSA